MEDDDPLRDDDEEEERDKKPDLITLQKLAAYCKKSGKALVKINNPAPPKIKPLQQRKSSSPTSNSAEISPVRQEEDGDTDSPNITNTTSTEVEYPIPQTTEEGQKGKIVVIIEAGVRQVTRGNEVQQYEHLHTTFVTHEDPNFHIDFEFYKKIYEKTRSIFATYDPIKGYIESNFDVQFVRPEAAYRYKTFKDTTECARFPIPMTSAQKQKAMDPDMQIGTQGLPTVTIKLYVAVEVSIKIGTQKPLRVAYKTNDPAVKNYINNTKAIALFRRHLSPGQVLLKLGEAFQQFEMESTGMEFKEWPTYVHLPPNHPVDIALMRRMGINPKGQRFREEEKAKPSQEEVESHKHERRCTTPAKDPLPLFPKKRNTSTTSTSSTSNIAGNTTQAPSKRRSIAERLGFEYVRPGGLQDQDRREERRERDAKRESEGRQRDPEDHRERKRGRIE